MCVCVIKKNNSDFIAISADVSLVVGTMESV